ncbi:MAG: histidine phosphotransferase [Rhodobacteraceae bacterium]|nr:MAG: histidine phosphotransferase [Paracoccaceae bacterium]
MGDSNVNLASLIGSRICHDLISPIGAITNGLELLDLTGGVQGPEMDLIADSVGNAGARIRFFRIAYGAAGEQIMGRPEVVSVLEDLNRGGRLSVAWGPLEGQSRGEVRLAFLALQCVETALPFGGEVRIMVEGGTWTVTGKAQKMNVDQGLWDGLSGNGTTEITPALVQFALLPAAAADLGRKVRMACDETGITLRF